MEERRVHLVIKGRVQGVGFRYFTYMNGINLQLKGWVRNRSNGDVEILAEGANDKLYDLIRKVRQGPDMATVLDIEIDWDEAKGDLPAFTILNTK